MRGGKLVSIVNGVSVLLDEKDMFLSFAVAPRLTHEVECLRCLSFAMKRTGEMAVAVRNSASLFLVRATRSI